jgi:hypothetical protein
VILIDETCSAPMTDAFPNLILSVSRHLTSQALQAYRVAGRRARPEFP